MSMGRIEVDADRCKGCALCVPVCPPGVIQMAGWFNVKGYHPAQLVDPEGKCTGCMLCATMCPDAAITVFRVDRPRKRRAKVRVAVQGDVLGSPLSLSEGPSKGGT